MIALREINRDNFSDVLKLSVLDAQKGYVASNMYSLAEAKAHPECIPLAVYNDDELVGFVMYGMDFEEKEYWIIRLMIDQEHQKKGYGRAAMRCVLARLLPDKDHDKVYISFVPDNAGAQKLYEQLGFVPDGRVIDGEIVYCLQYTAL